MLAIEFSHLLVILRFTGVADSLSIFFRASLRACFNLLFACALWNAEFVKVCLRASLYCLLIQSERMICRGQRHAFAASENLVATVLFVPLRERRRHVHLLNNLPPAYACVVSAERNLSLLRGIRNDAHFGSAEIIVK